MKRLKFRNNGKFHLMRYRVDLLKDNTLIAVHNRCEYFMACGYKIIANPDKVAARDSVPRFYVDDFCDECLEKSQAGE